MSLTSPRPSIEPALTPQLSSDSSELDMDSDIDTEPQELTTFANCKTFGFIATFPREVSLQRGFIVKITLDRDEVAYCRLGLSFVPAVPEVGHKNLTDSVGIIRVWETVDKSTEVHVRSDTLNVPPGIYNLEVELARANIKYPGKVSNNATRVTATRAVLVMEGSKL